MQNSTCTFPLITGENVAVCWPCCLKRHFSPTWIINSCIFVSLINTRSVINHLINKSSHPNLLITALTTKTWMGRWHWRRMRVMALLSGQCVHGLPPAFWRASKHLRHASLARQESRVIRNWFHLLWKHSGLAPSIWALQTLLWSNGGIIQGQMSLSPHRVHQHVHIVDAGSVKRIQSLLAVGFCSPALNYLPLSAESDA